jgi:hypothetical protein
MRRVLAFGLSMLLCGCGVSPALIKTDTIAFGEIIEDTTNKLLVVNVLRARDKAPLHFSDIPVIRESMQQTASLGFLDLVGSMPSSTTLRDTRSGTLDRMAFVRVQAACLRGNVGCAWAQSHRFGTVAQTH